MTCMYLTCFERHNTKIILSDIRKNSHIYNANTNTRSIQQSILNTLHMKTSDIKQCNKELTKYNVQITYGLQNFNCKHL